MYGFSIVELSLYYTRFRTVLLNTIYTSQFNIVKYQCSKSLAKGPGVYKNFLVIELHVFLLCLNLN